MEPGVVDGTKTVRCYTTATARTLCAGRLCLTHIRQEAAALLLLRGVIAAALAIVFFEVFPRVLAGVSEVHLILGSSLLLTAGAAPTAIGLAAGLAVQSLFFEPQDLPQYGMYATMLLAALFAVQAVAKRMLPVKILDLGPGCTHLLKMSLAFKGGIVAWVALWTLPCR